MLAARRQCLSIVVMLSAIGGLIGHSVAWGQGGAAPGYSSFTAEQLTTEADRLKSMGEWTTEVEEAVAKQAAVLLSQTDIITTLNDAMLSRLAKLAGPALGILSSEESQQLHAAISQASVAGREAIKASYDWVHFRVEAMQAADASREDSQELLQRWIADTGIERLTVEMTRWCLEQMLPRQAGRNEFSAVWTGRLTAPRSGEYVLSVCSINCNKSFPGETVRHAMKVFVNGQQVVDASPEKWAWEGSAVKLEAGKPTPLRVELTYSSTDSTYGDSPHALLYWKGPGLSRSIVSASTLTQPDGDAQGLRGEYRWTEAGRERSVVQSTPSLEFAWSKCLDVAPRDPKLVADLTSRLFELTTAAEYIAAQTGPPETRPAHEHPYFRNYTSAEFLTVGQRSRVMEVLLQAPELLQRADQQQILRLYRSLRFGDADLALEMLGTWMHARADVANEISQDYFDANRRFYRTVALYLAFRAPDAEHFKEFQERFLEMPDGRCCLPAAYGLAYAYLMTGKIEDWEQQLDGKLEDESLVGESRVNWLIARAHLAEIRLINGHRHEIGQETLGPGRRWLNEARDVAVEEATRRRLYSEELARLVAQNRRAQITDLLEAAVREVAAEDVEKWRTKAESIFTARSHRAADDERRAQEAYLEIINARRERAASQGDAQSTEKYDRVLQSFSADER